MGDVPEWVGLGYRFTPGWPWPKNSWGLDPMYGIDGWCRGCGTPNGPQVGHLTLQGNGFPSASVFVPNWTFDALCVDAGTAAEVAARFAVEFREVHKPRSGATGVQQLLPVVTADHWYDADELQRAVVKRHERNNGATTGATCTECKRWKWLPVIEGEARLRPTALTGDAGLIASPEFFGDGWKSFRHLLMKRPLGELLVSANPRTFYIHEVEVQPG